MNQTPPFEGIFGDTCELRLLQSLLPMDDTALSISKLAEKADTNLTEANEAVLKFVAWEILSSSRDQDELKYTLNSNSSIIRSMAIVNSSVIRLMLRPLMRQSEEPPSPGLG